MVWSDFIDSHRRMPFAWPRDYGRSFFRLLRRGRSRRPSLSRRSSLITQKGPPVTSTSVPDTISHTQFSALFTHRPADNGQPSVKDVCNLTKLNKYCRIRFLLEGTKDH